MTFLELFRVKIVERLAINFIEFMVQQKGLNYVLCVCPISNEINKSNAILMLKRSTIQHATINYFYPFELKTAIKSNMTDGCWAKL